jgi:hypothetical protein
MSKIVEPDFFAQYDKESDWAAGHGISQRTVSRYRALGLPFLSFGGFVWIPKAAASEWIAGRIRRRNPRRQKLPTTAHPAPDDPPANR